MLVISFTLLTEWINLDLIILMKKELAESKTDNIFLLDSIIQL